MDNESVITSILKPEHQIPIPKPLKMEEENKVTLHRTWYSPFAKRVELALKLKGIAFQYVEEDLQNKSPLLLNYNPVYKKVPVLVHNGKPLAESLCIIEYIDETWKNNSPPLLPEDPYKRAKVRFWTAFIHHQLHETSFAVMTTCGEAQEKAIKELSEKLQVLEEGMKEFFPDGSPKISNDSMGILEITICSLFGAFEIQEQVLGIKIIDPEKTPLIFSLLTAINQVPLVKESAPPFDKTVATLKAFRERNLSSIKS
ncbi:hypothetical protein COLO4_24510 [Corchorus olitorius]|uniref:glutathione transferase n=1 Tax=Corchorus olitorius TaxID=93759 RepID=A0A1R3I9B1_9ROSI|nr:hypothetical protein COLO4_24510 [Corchorus olitorius]